MRRNKGMDVNRTYEENKKKTSEVRIEEYRKALYSEWRQRFWGRRRDHPISAVVKQVG